MAELRILKIIVERLSPKKSTRSKAFSRQPGISEYLSISGMKSTRAALNSPQVLQSSMAMRILP
jgi:hypothetical protein